MTIRTLTFLPSIFKSDANRKFLNATMDQLVTEPDMTKLNGYVGRKFAPTFKTTDNYLAEVDADRQNYQLEPCVVTTDVSGNIQSVGSYMDLINKIKYYGGVTSNHSRMFANEAYSFDGLIDFDKMVNFNQYYWIPEGPDPVDVFAGTVDDLADYTVTRNTSLQAYQFTDYGTDQNPDIVLARGGVYNFIVDQPGNKFWIQTDPGLSGTRSGQPNIDSRAVYGVEGNGADSGIVTFKVPLRTAQDYYVSMPVVEPGHPLNWRDAMTSAESAAIPLVSVDLATDAKFIDIDGMLVANLSNGIDGISANLAGKYLVFVGNDVSDTSWDEKGIFALGDYGDTTYDEGDLIPSANRADIWQIQLRDTGDGDQLIELVWVQDIPTEHKVFIKSGKAFANKEFYKTDIGTLVEVPLITAPLDELFYNDGSDQHYYGRIKLVDNSTAAIDIDVDILGKKNYTSPNGVVFTNGLLVRFGSQVSPVEYANESYYVEGVGVGIKLVSKKELVTPEAKSTASINFDIYGFSSDFFDESLNGPLTPDYITINRASIDGNAWSRSNRWVHNDVIVAASRYNKTTPNYTQIKRATRPIIEFDADLRLFNYGHVGKHNISIVDFTVTDAMNEVEGNASTYFTLANVRDGMTIIFARDSDPTVRNRVYTVSVVDIDGVKKVHLTPVDGGNVQYNDVIIPTSGVTVALDAFSGDDSLRANTTSRKMSTVNGLGNIDLSGVLLNGTDSSKDMGLIVGNAFWFDGANWILAQQKPDVNVVPLFDIVDKSLTSFGDNTAYENTSFRGCKLLSYAIGSGTDDTVLGFPLSYRSFENVGDIEFDNHFDSMTFTYAVNRSNVTVKTNTGFVPRIVDRATVSKTNMWAKKVEPTKQYQIISNVCDGITSYFEIDILPDAVATVPNIKVYVNSKEIKPALFSIESVGDRIAVNVQSGIAKGDRVDILIYSSDVSALGYYEVPQNLDFNALNKSFSTLTLGQFRNHLATLGSNCNQLVGQALGSNNVRDLDIKSQGGNILQHGAPSVYANLFLLEKDVNFIDSISYAQREYTKFKNKFLELFSAVVNADISDPVEGVDYILHKINAVKNSSMPWYYSDMVPYDANRTLIEYTVLNISIDEYEIDSIFVDTELSNKAILVYLNGTQLVRGIDYTFNQTRPSIVFNVAFNYDDKIKIVVFNNTDGCYVPETPTKMGLYPKFTPEIYTDTTYRNPVTMIRGHDGSVTPAFGDIRDDLLLELEKRIYNNIKAQYNVVDFDIYDHLPGKFRTTDYTRSEFNQVVSRAFLEWIGSNRVDFSSNKWFESNNSWSWTYKKFRDKIDGEFLPGYWRGIYKHFFDTDAPHTRPWECLGFSEMPLWWEDEYGPSPYTGGNLVLWGDLETGTIKRGDRAGTYAKYARPGLSAIIPVTDTGELKTPDQFITANVISSEASGSFAIGDCGPVEMAWRNSSDYPFAVQQALALMKPAIYFGQLASIQKYYRHNGVSQFVEKTTAQRETPSDLIINQNSARNAGYLNWISDYVRSNGADPVSVIGSYLNSLTVQLAYKMAGFTDKSYIRVLAEQYSPSSTNDSIIIPDENYKIYLHKSSPVDRIIYSAVIVEKTQAGYSVSGYNTENPVFTIVPSEANSNQKKLSVGTATGIIYKNYQPVKVTVPYGFEFRNKQQVVDFLISYGRYLKSRGLLFDEFNQTLGQLQDWELSAKEFLTWTEQGWATGNIIVLSPLSNTLKLNYQDAVVDKIDNSPAGSKVLDVAFNVVPPSSFNVIRESDNFTLSTESEISIGLVDLSMVQYEHVLVFDNETLFNDVIYKPELGNRQYRLKIIGSKTAQWSGQVNPPGFMFSNPTVNEWQVGQDYRKGDIVLYKSIYYTALQMSAAQESFNFGEWKQIDKSAVQSGLLPNFAYNAKKFEMMYDVDDQLTDQNFNKYATGLIGYRDRSYLLDLGLNDITKVKFYQGFIRDKGTMSAIDALTNATFNNMSGGISINEEWAFRVGEYGAIANNQFVEVQLSDSKFVHTPISMELLNDGEYTEGLNINPLYKNTLYKKPLKYIKNIFDSRNDDTIYENDIETAGYVNLSDVDTTIFDLRNYTDLSNIVADVHSGYKIWVAKDINRDWNVYRVDESNVSITNVAYALDGYAYVTMSESHGLSATDIFIIRNFDTSIDGFYRVERVEDVNTVFVSITSALEEKMTTVPSYDGVGTMFTLSSMRFDLLTHITDAAPISGWKTTDKVWVDDVDSGWKVYTKTEPWEYAVSISTDVMAGHEKFGSTVAMTADGQLLISSAPGKTKDQVTFFVKELTGLFQKSAGIVLPESTDIVGEAVAISHSDLAFTVVTSTGDRSVTIYGLESGRITGKFPYDDNGVTKMATNYSIVDPANSSTSRFGQSIALSEDGSRLVITSPGAMKSYVYNKGLDGKFTLEVEIASPAGSLGFGNAVGISNTGSIIAISASLSPLGSTIGVGKVYVFGIDKISHQVTPFTPLVPTVTTLGARFGDSVCILGEGATIFVGSPNANTDSYKNGFVYRFDRDYALPNAFSLSQVIEKPYKSIVEYFGSAISARGSRLAISSRGAMSINDTSIDNGALTLDGSNTRIIDRQKNAGAVYVYDLLTDESTSKYDFTQSLTKSSIRPNDEFGKAVVVGDKQIAVGSPLSDLMSEDGGRVVLYNNESAASGWTVLRQQLPKVDLDNINKMFLYSIKTQNILTYLDYIDPAKGKVLGIADQDIAYRTSFDPASYNMGSGSNVNIDTAFHWNKKQVGKVWWNLDQVRYLDYEQDGLTYRNTNWGKLFPGASIDVYEWVESSVPPIQYQGEGTPKSTSYYVLDSAVNETTGAIETKYYFWVKDITTFDENLPFRRSSVSAIASLIKDPLTQGIPYAAAIKTNAVTLFNCESYISADDTVLHVNYSLLPGVNAEHNEYELTAESTTSALPEKIVSKLIDSLSGADAFGNSVPDHKLSPAEKFGIGIRPRQTMVSDRLTAVKNVVQFVNSLFTTVPMVEEFDLTSLRIAESIPDATFIDPITGAATVVWNMAVTDLDQRSYVDTSALPTGYLILVKADSSLQNQWSIYSLSADKSFKLVRSQSYDTSDYWYTADWYDSSFDPTVKPTHTVETYKDISKLTLSARDTIKVKNNGSGRFTVYRVKADLSLVTVGIEGGTIQLSDSLWGHSSSSIGFDNDNYDVTKYDLNPTIELRNIMYALRDTLLTKTLSGEFNKMFFMLLNYILSEQKMVDWAFKTSFVSVLHKLRKLEQYPNYIRDNQSYYEDFINEVKPFRTKIREYVIDYEGSDTAQIHPTDFDVPSYFDSDFNSWRAPNGEHARDATLLATQPQYADWNANHTFAIESVTVTDPGYGYTIAPELEVTGGGGSGAVLEAVVDFYSGSVIKVIVKNPGSGYTSTPTITPKDGGAFASGLTNFRSAQFSPKLFNGTVRSVTTGLRFNRMSYSEIKEWQANRLYAQGDVVKVGTALYAAKVDLEPSVTFESVDWTYIDPSYYDEVYNTAAEAVMEFYTPTVGMPPKDLARLFHGTEYSGNRVDGGKDSDTADGLDVDTNIQSLFTDLELGTRPEDINIVGGAFVDTFNSHAPEELLPGIVFDTLDMQVYTVDLDNPQIAPIGYRISKTLLNETKPANIDAAWEFRRIAKANITELAMPLDLTDTTIYVKDASKLPIPGPHLTRPGVIYINGEKITYYKIDLANNALKQIRRGVWGTGAALTHVAGSYVVDASMDQKIPDGSAGAKYETWLTKPSYYYDKLMSSTTVQAMFLKEKTTLLPHAPGENPIRVDPNVNKTRFDDDGFGEYLTPVHPYDIDPFDSYDA